MSESAPLQAESSEVERYKIHARGEMASLLRQVQRRHLLVTLYFHGGSQFIVTNLLDVRPETGELLFDHGAQQKHAHPPTRFPRFTLVTFLDQVKLQFSGERLKTVMFESRPALLAAFPEYLLRFQRREYFRTSTRGKPVSCLVPLPGADGRVIDARITDIGCGGISLLARPDHQRFEKETQLPGCSIMLPDIGQVRATLQIRDSSETSAGAAPRQFRYGCAFLGMQGTMTAMIQRFVDRLQRERLTRS